jgi:hypothetical protein
MLQVIHHGSPPESRRLRPVTEQGQQYYYID